MIENSCKLYGLKVGRKFYTPELINPNPLKITKNNKPRSSWILYANNDSHRAKTNEE